MKFCMWIAAGTFLAFAISPSATGRAQTAVATTPLFSLQTIDGERTMGVVARIDGDDITFIEGAQAQEQPRGTTRPLDEVFALERVVIDADEPQEFKAVDPVRRGAPRLWLSNGDRLAIELIAIDEAFLTARVLSLSGQPTWQIPLELVRGYAESERSPPAFEFAGRPPAATGTQADVLLLKNGDRIAGELRALANGEFDFATATASVTVPLEGIVAFAMNPELMEIPDLDGKRELVVLTDGSFFTVHGLSAQDGQWAGETAFGQAVSFPAGDAKSVTFLGRRAVMLSDIEPAAYEFTPFFSRQRDFKLDAAVDGGPLIVAGREYVKGLGLHSQCQLTYSLAKRYSRFQALAGIDDAVAEKGQAWLTILVDGEPRVERLLLRGPDDARQVEVDRLEQADELTILVEFGPFGDVCDHVDLVDARLIRQESVPR